MSYVQRITFDGFIIWESGRGTSAWLETEDDTTDREMVFDQISRPGRSLYRQTLQGQRHYRVTVTIHRQTQALLQLIVAEWRRVHQVNGERVLERVAASGRRFYLDCVPTEPKIQYITPWTVHIEQEYVSAKPYWRGELDSLTTAFDNATPVTADCANGGDTATWLGATITGEVVNPLITLASGVEVGLNYTVAAGETLIIQAEPPAEMLLNNVNVYGYRTEDTNLNGFCLSVGSSNVTLTATSGTGGCTLWWYPLYEGFR